MVFFVLILLRVHRPSQTHGWVSFHLFENFLSHYLLNYIHCPVLSPSSSSGTPIMHMLGLVCHVPHFIFLFFSSIWIYSCDLPSSSLHFPSVVSNQLLNLFFEFLISLTQFFRFTISTWFPFLPLSFHSFPSFLPFLPPSIIPSLSSVSPFLLLFLSFPFFGWFFPSL